MKERMSKMKAKSKDFIRGFMGMFGRDGRLVGDCMTSDMVTG